MVNVKDMAKEASGERRIEFLESSVKHLITERKKLWRELEGREEFLKQLMSCIVDLDPLPPRPYRKPTKPTYPIVPVLKFSDWHIGEKINPKETEGFGKFNWAIAQKRVRDITEAFLKWIETQRHGYSIDECVILAEGDFISGDIHRELAVTNEFPLPVQTARAGYLLAEAIRIIAPNFKKVRVIEVGADNHGRLQPKPQFKQKTQNNMSYLVYEIANNFLASHKNVEIERSVGIKYLAEINGWKILSEHGDNVKAWMGIPFYGLERARAREATRRMNGGKGFHYVSIGHWHVPGWVSGNILINGSLSGTTEFDHGCGRHAPPAQVAFLVGKHGVFNFVPFTAE